jgi:D-alanyl-D-alanine carboxypeptidase
MLFAIGSITKNVMAALALSLAEDGVLSLEDPVGRWLPPRAHVDPAISVRQLLNHTSGVYQYFSSDRIWEDLAKDRGRRWTAEEVLSYIQEPYFLPGGGFRYSNTNYTLLGLIVERATGSRVSDELRRRFWKPLGITGVRCYAEEETGGPLAHVWGTLGEGESERDLATEPRLAHESIVHPSGGLFMTAEALARWCQALFSGKVIRRESLAEMTRFVRTPRRQLPDTVGYGLGLQSYRGRFVRHQRAYGHGGGSIGSIAYMVHLPDQQACVAAMTNSYNGRFIAGTTTGLIEAVVKASASKKPAATTPPAPAAR